MRLDVKEQSEHRLRWNELQRALIGDLKRRLVAQLEMPALWFAIAENGVDEVLRVLRQRCRADDAQLNFKLVE